MHYLQTSKLRHFHTTANPIATKMFCKTTYNSCKHKNRSGVTDQIYIYTTIIPTTTCTISTNLLQCVFFPFWNTNVYVCICTASYSHNSVCPTFSLAGTNSMEAVNLACSSQSKYWERQSNSLVLRFMKIYTSKLALSLHFLGGGWVEIFARTYEAL